MARPGHSNLPPGSKISFVQVVTCATHESLQAAIVRDGFAFVRGDAMRSILAPFGTCADWGRFADSWNDLAVDSYMADGGRYRRRRHAVFVGAMDGVLLRQPHQPHYQAVDYNPLNGGVARWFEPVRPDIGESATLRTILAHCRSFFTGLKPGAPRWRVEVHQFRIEACTDQEGRPTPEGLHRDGVDYALVLLIQRRNIESGTTAIHGLDGRPLGTFTLTDSFDTAIVDDRRVSHGVTPVRAIDAGSPACRDVLVVTFTRASSV